jgi:hypothetical protein
MSINITALNALLPPKARAPASSGSSVFPAPQGPSDLTLLKALPSNLGVSDRYLRVIDRFATTYVGRRSIRAICPIMLATIRVATSRSAEKWPGRA